MPSLSGAAIRPHAPVSIRFNPKEAGIRQALPDLLAAVRAGAPKAALVWATTTPVRVAGKTDRVKARNAAVATFMATVKIPVNDLFAAVVDKPELFSPDGVHLTGKGSSVLGGQVADHVAKALGGTR